MLLNAIYMPCLCNTYFTQSAGGQIIKKRNCTLEEFASLLISITSTVVFTWREPDIQILTDAQYNILKTKHCNTISKYENVVHKYKKT